MTGTPTMLKHVLLLCVSLVPMPLLCAVTLELGFVPKRPHAVAQTSDEKALCVATHASNVAEITRLLGKGTNPYITHNRVPLFAAALMKNVAVLKPFLTHGLDPNDVVSIVVPLDSSGDHYESSTASYFHLACAEIFAPCFAECKDPIESRLSVIDTLIEHKANVNAPSLQRGETPLMTAVPGHPAIVERLLAHKADPNIQDWDGSTALMACARKGNLVPTFPEYAIARLLVTAGADITLRDRGGLSVLNHSKKPEVRCLYARHQQYPQIQNLLCEPTCGNLPRPLIKIITAYIKNDDAQMKEIDFPVLQPLKKIVIPRKKCRCVVS